MAKVPPGEAAPSRKFLTRCRAGVRRSRAQSCRREAGQTDSGRTRAYRATPRPITTYGLPCDELSDATQISRRRARLEGPLSEAGTGRASTRTQRRHTADYRKRPYADRRSSKKDPTTIVHLAFQAIPSLSVGDISLAEKLGSAGEAQVRSRPSARNTRCTPVLFYKARSDQVIIPYGLVDLRTA